MVHCTMVESGSDNAFGSSLNCGDVMAALYIPCRRIACTLLVFGEPGFGLRPRLSPRALAHSVPYPPMGPDQVALELRQTPTGFDRMMATR